MSRAEPLGRLLPCSHASTVLAETPQRSANHCRDWQISFLQVWIESVFITTMSLIRLEGPMGNEIILHS